ncbi:MAG: hypothetical protein ABWZ57_01295 [Mesorhizobium sp.]
MPSPDQALLSESSAAAAAALPKPTIANEGKKDRMAMPEVYQAQSDKTRPACLLEGAERRSFTQGGTLMDCAEREVESGSMASRRAYPASSQKPSFSSFGDFRGGRHA